MIEAQKQFKKQFKVTQRQERGNFSESMVKDIWRVTKGIFGRR